MAFANRAEGKKEAQFSGLDAFLIGMGDGAWIHESRGAEGIFMAEIGADQQFVAFAELFVDLQIAGNLVVALEEHRADFAMAVFEIAENECELGLAGAVVHLAHRLDDAGDAVDLRRI